jgi:hypothetical protein
MRNADCDGALRPEERRFGSRSAAARRLGVVLVSADDRLLSNAGRRGGHMGL